MKTFSILGTGFLGLALARELRVNYKVKVSIRTKDNYDDLINEGLFPYLLNEDNFSFLDELLDTDFLFINFPPRKSNNYLEFLNKIYSHKKIANIKKIIFISSTSIYPNENGNFTENFKIKNSVSKIVFEAEELIKNKTHVIFRCAGLMGENRIAGKYFSNKVVDFKDKKVNYVHRDDVINALKFIIQIDKNGIFNLCSFEHPTIEEVYLINAKKYKFEKVIFKDTKEYKNRLIDGSKIQRFGFEYKYPNPLEY